MIFLKHFGTLSGLGGHAAFFFLVFFIFKRWHRKEVFYTLPVFWAIYPIIESHMEGILILFRQQDLSFNNLVRPIEGFRFYSFLAQPLALCVALTWEQILKSRMFERVSRFRNQICVLFVVVLTTGLLSDLYLGFKINQRILSNRVTMDDIQATYWFRENSSPDDRVIADYYTTQMISGICAGRALLGSMFPLKGAGIPYISDSWKVLYDIHKFYQSEDINAVREIARRYGITHVYYSKDVLRKIEFVLNGYGDTEGFDAGKYDVLQNVAHEKTLLNPRFSKVIYERGDLKILAILDGH